MLLSTLKIAAAVSVLGFSSLAYAQVDTKNADRSPAAHAKKAHSEMQSRSALNRKRLNREIIVVGTVDRKTIAAPSYRVVLPKITLEFPEYQVYIAS